MVSNSFTDVNVVENVTVFYVLYTPEQNNTNAKKRKAALLSFFSSLPVSHCSSQMHFFHISIVVWQEK